MCSWCGDDWRRSSKRLSVEVLYLHYLDTWGLADVEAAAAAIVGWVETVGWNGPSVDVNGWFCTGHSNGGKYQNLR